MLHPTLLPYFDFAYLKGSNG